MTPETNTVFSEDEQLALAALVGLIIPASDAYDQPGADDPDILAEILKSGSAICDRLAPALATLISDGNLEAKRVAAFQLAFPTEAEMIQTLTAQCYYRDARVMRALDIEVRPPFPDGYQQQPNDFSLLDPVRERGEIYRKLP